MSRPGMLGAALGALLAAAGAATAIVLIRWGMDKEPRKLLAALSAGILGRLLLFGAVLVYVALETAIDPLATAVSLLGFYVLFQVLELWLVVRGLKRRRV